MLVGPESEPADLLLCSPTGGNPSIFHIRTSAALDKPYGQGQIGLMSYAIDTAATIADLESAGVEPSQAKAIVRAINGAAGDPASKADLKELRDEMDRKFATKSDLAILKNQLTTRIVVSQVATATLLFMLLKFFA